MGHPSTLQLPNLQTKWLGKTIYEFNEVDSTQDVLKKELNAQTPTGLVILAKRQTKGRGRQGRTWMDIPGEQVFSSILLRPRLPLNRLPILNIAAGLAMCDGLEEFGIPNVSLKWPNDVFVTGRKISGILSDLIQTTTPHSIILGIGLNISGKTHELPPEIRSIATTLEQQKPNPDRLKLFAILLNHLEEWVETLESGNITSIQEEFKRRFVYSGLSISVQVGGQTLTGFATEIDASGALVLLTPGGTHRIVSGEVVT